MCIMHFDLGDQTEMFRCAENFYNIIRYDKYEHTGDKTCIKLIIFYVFEQSSEYSNRYYSKARILRTRIIRIRAYSEVISIPRQNPFKMIRKKEG